MRWAWRVIPPVVPLVVVVAAMEGVSRAGWVKPYILPAPSAVLRAMTRDSGELWRAMLGTAVASAVGFAASAVVGVVLAVLLSSSAVVQRAFYPYAVFFQTVPVIAIAPLLVIWCGYGMPTVVTSAFIVSIFPVVANTLTGLLSTDPALRDLFRLYGASGWARVWKLRLPSALPNVMTGLRIAAGLSVIGAIVGEFIGGGGLGAVVDEARTRQSTDKVFAAVLLASVLGLGLFGVVNFASWVALRRWHASEQGGRND